jgi:hypothetical protein
MVIRTVFPTLFKNNTVQIERNQLSPIDIIQVQRKYGCNEASIQEIVAVGNKSTDYINSFVLKFETEAANLKIPESVSYSYLVRSMVTCGVSHYWPLDYPIVEHDHELYRAICRQQKPKNEPCKFTLECQADLECAKILFRNGVCRQTNSNVARTFFRILSSKFKQASKQLSKIAW